MPSNDLPPSDHDANAARIALLVVASVCALFWGAVYTIVFG
jgi:hypothetical protein